VPYAESPRTRIGLVTSASAARAVAAASATIRASPFGGNWPQPRASRIPAITGAAVSVLIVAGSGEGPCAATLLPAILVCQ
jgi:hypothetical protein